MTSKMAEEARCGIIQEGKYYFHMECSVSTTKNEHKIYLHVADVDYHHDCWLGVTIKDIAAAWEKL